MSNSPYLPVEVKTYIKKYEIEQLINRTMNTLLKRLPEDPYAFLIGEFQKLASPSIQIISIDALETISGDGFPCIKTKPTVVYMNKELSFLVNNPFPIMSEEQNIYDEDRLNGKGMNKSIAFLKEKVLGRIIGLKCEHQQDIDRQLEKVFLENNNNGIYVINTVSFLIPVIRSHLLSVPLFKIYQQISENYTKKDIKMMVNCLQGGKIIGSKCKVFKYYILSKNVQDPYLAQIILQNIRKLIVGGKGGESALKISGDGTFVCPLDTIMDNLKIVEDAIISSNAKDHFSIGLSWMADTLFSPETKKYELQNPKTPFDNDQMIDYLIKLLQDKPSIQYLEDPLASSEKAAWKKLKNRIKQVEAIKNVKIGSRSGKILNLLDSGLKNQINQLSIDQTPESHPESTEEVRKTCNSLKFNLDYVQIRAFELKTVSAISRVYKELKKSKTQLILQDNTFETYDTSLIDLAYGFDCFSSLGSITKYDRISKLNRIKQLAHEIIQ